MSLNLPDHVRFPSSTGRHNLAIAEVAIFGVIFLFQLIPRSVQEWQYWSSKRRRRNVARCLFRGIVNLISIVALIRIVGNVLYLAIDNPDKSIAVVIVILQGVGFAPLVTQLNFLVVKCGVAGIEDRSQSLYPRAVKLAIQWSRLPIVIAVILIVVAGCIINLTLLKAGALVLLGAFIYLAGLMLWIAFGNIRHKLTRAGQIGLWIAVCSLPMYVIRVTYLLLVEFGSVRFSPVFGDWHIMAGMGFAMEVIIIALLVAGGLFVEPLTGVNEKRMGKPKGDGNVASDPESLI